MCTDMPVQMLTWPSTCFERRCKVSVGSEDTAAHSGTKLGADAQCVWQCCCCCCCNHDMRLLEFDERRWRHTLAVNIPQHHQCCTLQLHQPAAAASHTHSLTTLQWQYCTLHKRLSPRWSYFAHIGSTLIKECHTHRQTCARHLESEVALQLQLQHQLHQL